MTIEVIKYQSGNWHLQINGVQYFFTGKPIMLFAEKSFLPLEPNCENGLRWRIKGNWISYKQIRKNIKNFKLCTQQNS